MKQLLFALSCVAFLCCPAFAGLVNTKGALGTSVSTLTTTNFTTTTGNFLIGAVRHDSNRTLNSVSTVSSTCIVDQRQSDVTQIGALDLFHCANITGNANDNVTVNLSGSASIVEVAVLQYSGPPASEAIDQIVYGSSSNPFVPQTTPQFTTTFANEYIVSCIAYDVSDSNRQGAGYVAEVNEANDVTLSRGLWCEDKTVSTIQTNIAAAYTGINRFMIYGISIKNPVPALTITKTHTGNFTQGETGAYTVTVGNNGTGPTSGTVTMTETIPSGLTVTSMTGTGWTCNTSTCTRSDALSNSSAYPAITVNVSVGAATQSPQVNQVSASGGGSSTSPTASDSTNINASGALSDLTIQGTTETQIAVSYTATSTSACRIGAVDQNGGPIVNDVDSTKFANANLDLSRTVANGFRWPSLCGGSACSGENTDVHRTVFIGGHDEVKQGTDGKWYSTALQVNSQHSVTVVCDLVNGATVFPVTQNLPLASNYPELPIPTPGSPVGGMPQPTIDWSRAGRSKAYIDPITGVLIQRITGGNDFMTDAPAAGGVFQTPVLDVNGSAWTSPNNFITNQVAGTLATTTTVNAPLFAAFSSAFTQDPNARWTDFSLTPYGSASSGSVVAEWCISIDSGQTCANYTPLDVTYSASAQPYAAIPSSTPDSFFSGWGGMKTAFGSEDLLNRSITGASASGSTVTISSPANTNGSRRFYLGLVPGSKFTMTSCGAGAQSTPLTVASVNNQASITTVESGLALTNCTYTDMHAGIRAVMKNSGTLNVSFQMTAYQAREFGGGTSAAHYYCAKSKVTDIQTDCDGVDHTGSPLSGYLCQFGVGGGSAVFLVQDNGRMCLQSNLYSPTAPSHLSINSVPAWTDNRCALGTDQQNPSHLWKACHIANNYLEMPADNHPAPDVVDTRMTYTDLGVAQASNSQIIALGGPAGAAAATGLWPPLSFETVLDDHNGNAILQFNSFLTGDGLCMKAWSTLSGTVISTMPAYGSYPLGYTACHAAPANGGGYVFVGTRGADNSLAPYRYSTGSSLGGPFTADVIGVRKNGSWINTTIPISTCTKASPTVCTSTASNLDDFQFIAAGSSQTSLITISGATGTGWSTGLNATLYAHKIDANTFSLYTTAAAGTAAPPLDSTGFGTLGGTIVGTLARPIYSLHIGSVSNSAGKARITVDTTEGGPQRYYPSIAGGSIAGIMFDADPITIVNTYLNSTTQYYAKVTCAGCSSSQFDVYSDSGLTTPVPFGTLSGANGWYVVYAERCPDPATITLAGPMYTDTGFGTTGAGNQKIRCVGIRLNSEMESNYPNNSTSPTEHAAYPPPPSSVEASNVNKSMLHQINVGDGMIDSSHVNGAHEILYTLSVDRSVSENQIDVVVERAYGDDPNYAWRGTTNGIRTDTYAMQHSPGWTAEGTGIVASIILDPTVFPVTYLVPQLNGSHFDLVGGSTAGTVTSASGYDPGPPDDVIDASISAFATSVAAIHNSHPLWSGDTTSLSSLAQSYPGKRNIFNQTPPSERVWKSDWAAPNIGFGTGANAMDGTGLTRTLTNVSGIVWKMQLLTTANMKVSPIFAAAFPYNYFTDKSGPAVWSQANGTSCYAYSAGECIAGSSRGDFYIASTTLQTAGAPGGQCITNDATVGAPCGFGLWPGMGWALQVRQTPIDLNATGFRRLTQGFWPGMGQYYAYNWVSSPEGKWGFFAGNPLGQRPKAGNTGSDFYAMKLPPWPTADNVARTTYVSMPIQLQGTSGDQIRIAFGYGENGDPSKFYCTTRQERCWTSASPTPSSPFVFDSETQNKTSCNSGCSVSIPAIPGRIVFYQIERSNGTDVRLGAIQALSVR